MIRAFTKIGEIFLGKKFLQGRSFIDFIRDGFRLAFFIFTPWILLGNALILEMLIKLLIGVIE